jgi:hypothetical protein
VCVCVCVCIFLNFLLFSLSLSLSQHSHSHTHTHTQTTTDFYLKLISATPGADVGEEKARMDKLVTAFKASDMIRKNPLAADTT